ncbi:30S ribosomal protein S8 [Candidatus Cyanaurora vandensis]|uniref:30S ribosomal protein S8 n=1 Tax=Candidatus Cyanaurora vandensis TaxID=2714958 RepID=UPI00258084C7|nr:30S ribosomal protein S8 [Candidatus Cyanaurora vandensis]
MKTAVNAHVTDTVADLLTRVRNANMARHQSVRARATRLTRDIARVLYEEGFILGYEEVGEGIAAQVELFLKYKGQQRKPIITNLKRISRPGLRVYSNHRELPRVLGGIGIAIISTSSGVMTDREARRRGIGGEVLCHVY